MQPNMSANERTFWHSNIHREPPVPHFYISQGDATEHNDPRQHSGMSGAASLDARFNVRIRPAVFRNLRTSTKLSLLCSAFVLSIIIVTYGLIAEKRIAIDFVRKEIVGLQYLEAVRGVYAWILANGLTSPLSTATGPSTNQVLDGLADAQSHTAG